MRRITYFCDLCKSEVKEDSLQRFIDENYKSKEEDQYDICAQCRISIVQKVINEKLINLPPWCKDCGGKGFTKESVEVGCHDRPKYENKKCEACKL